MDASPTILLVEDDENDLFLVQRSIERSRLVNPVRVVRDGEEAIRYLAGEGCYSDRRAHPRPFLMLLDLHMPLVNGFEVLRWVRERPEYASLKIAVLTASSDERDYQRAMELGADSYFIKPGSLDEFVNLMMRIQGHWMLLDGQQRPIRTESLLTAKR
jgi:CheY-like chemotaxis protein